MGAQDGGAGLWRTTDRHRANQIGPSRPPVGIIGQLNVYIVVLKVHDQAFERVGGSDWGGNMNRVKRQHIVSSVVDG